jgi:hypothetical protein
MTPFGISATGSWSQGARWLTNSWTDKLAEETQLAAASVALLGVGVRLVVLLALEWLALSVNAATGCDRAVLFGLAFGDLELDDANSGADDEGFQLANWTRDRGGVRFEECVEELTREIFN